MLCTMMIFDQCYVIPKLLVRMIINSTTLDGTNVSAVDQKVNMCA